MRGDPEVQVHEDAFCLVFLEMQLDGLAAALGEDRTTDVLAQTWQKMGTDARGLAPELELSPKGRRLVEKVRES